LHILPDGGWDRVPSATREALERHMHFARNLRVDTHVIAHSDIPAAIAAFAREQGITQIFMGRSIPRPWYKRFGETVVQRVVRLSPATQITIVTERRR
jgi:K+-sensing histidine kinase KdpD